MATSLLAGYNWADLSAEEMTSAVQALAIATQERYNIAFTNTNGSIPNPTRLARSKYFPYKSNTGLTFELNEGDPLQDFSGYIETLLSASAERYADIEKWDDADTDSDTGTTSFVLSNAADAPLTYDNRLFEVTGYTSWPDLSVYAKEEVKKWYDMLTTFKYVIRTTGFNRSTSSGYHIYKGEFEVGTDPFYNVDDAAGQGADFYGIDETSATLEDPATTTPYSDMKTANTNYQTSTAATFNEDTEAADYTYDDQPYTVRLRRDSSGDYISCLRAHTDTHVLKWDQIRTFVGMTGKPVGYKRQASVTISETFPTGEDTNMSYPYLTTADEERFYCDLTVSEVLDTTEITIDLDIDPATMPTNLTDIAADENVTVFVDVTFIGNWLEDWDGDGGFEYYTPP